MRMISPHPRTFLPIPRERISPTLEHHRRWPVHLHHLGHHRHEQSLVTGVVDPGPQGEVQGVVLAVSSPDIPGSGVRMIEGEEDKPEVPGAREILPVLMEAHGHHSI